MPSAVLRKKLRSTFTRRRRNRRRASVQASQASRSIVSSFIGDTALPQPTSSNAVIQTYTGTLHKGGEARDAEGQFINIYNCHILPAVTTKDDAQRSRQTSELPSTKERLADFSLSNWLPKTLLPSPFGKTEVPKRASLMGIPVELRVMIFKCVFPQSDQRGTAETILYCAPTLRVLGPSHSQLCRVNHQIYEETRELLYGQTLVFLSREALTKFSAARTGQQMSQLRSICMKPRVTDWAGAIKSLVLPPAASLTIHWPITRELWQALTSNITLDYRQVNVLFGHEGQRVVFEAVTELSAKRPTYECLQRTFAAKSG